MAISQNFPNTRPSLNLNFARSKTLDPRITFERPSTSGNATYVDESGIIRYASADEPRFDFDPVTGECLGLLVEESRTNLITDSSLTTVGDTLGGSLTSTTETNPEGIDFCQKFQASAITTNHRVRVPDSSSNSTTVSAFVKKDTHRYVYIGFGGQAHSYTVLFDIEPGLTGTRLLGQGGQGTYTNIGAGYQDYPNGWVRIWAAGTTTGIDGTTIGLSPDDATYNITNWSAAGTEAIFIHGVQYEDNATFPTSYIPTTTSAVTRAADVASISGTNFSSWYRQDEGTVFYDTTIVSAPEVGNPEIVSVSDGTANNYLGVFIPAQLNHRAVVKLSGANEYLANAIPTEDVFNPAKVALAYQEDNTISAGNGDLAPLDTSCTLPTVDQLHIGHPTGGAELSQRIRRLVFWPTRLSNETLQAITQ